MPLREDHLGMQVDKETTSLHIAIAVEGKKLEIALALFDTNMRERRCGREQHRLKNGRRRNDLLKTLWTHNVPFGSPKSKPRLVHFRSDRA